MICFVIKLISVILIAVTITGVAVLNNDVSNSDNSDRCSRNVTYFCGQLCENERCEIRAAVILPKNSSLAIASLPKVLPLLEKAIDDAYKLNIIPAYLKVTLMPKNDNCDASYAQIAIIESFTNKNCTNVIFGPTCDYSLATVSRIVKFFHTPLLTAGGFSHDFDKLKKDCSHEYYMLIRTGMLVFKGLSQFFKIIADSYGWRKVAFLYDKQGQNDVAGENTCSLVMQTVAQELRNVYGFQYKDGDLGLSLFNMSEFIKKVIGVNHGIIVMCASREKIHEILLAAESLGMMVYNGEYVFFNIELINKAEYSDQPWINRNGQTNIRLQNAYKSVITLTSLSEEIYENDSYQIRTKSNYSSGFYDAMMLYLTTISEFIKDGGPEANKNTVLDGNKLVRRMYQTSFAGLNGRVFMNDNGDRITEYSLLTYNPHNNRFQVAANYKHGESHFKLIPGKQIFWSNGLNVPPLDTPICGYDNSKCPVKPPYALLLTILTAVATVLGFLTLYMYRRYKLETEISAMSWKVCWEEVSDVQNPNPIRGSHVFLRSGSSRTLYSEIYSLAGDKQIFMPIGIFRNKKVALKKLPNCKIELTREQLIRLKRVQDLQHDHLVKFYGACLDSPHCCILTEYCQKGSLQDLLENDEIKLEWLIRISLIQDLVRGMTYLHQSEIKSHGSLTSTNCVVDSRLVLKVTDFGLHFLNNSEEYLDSYAYWRRKLWIAPELLRMENILPEGTQKGDVYSFGIIMHEIVLRRGPFYLGEEIKLTPKDIVESVKNCIPSSSGQPLRPLIDDTATEDEVSALMRRCWAEDVADRPDFPALKNIIRKLNKEHDNGNILDNLLSRMEQYANNLEQLVEERTADYLEEKRKCEELLYQLLPKSVASQLIMGQSVIAETYDQVTIYFSDIVGFTSLSATSTPLQVVDLLNDLYTCFDSIIENFDVYKVETIGDAYMVVSGLPVRNGTLHAREIARMALALLGNVHKFSIRHRPGEELKLRIGMHTGPCVAGVVGLKMPRYCLFGDTVNTASRMESNGAPLRIHVSPTTKEVLDTFSCFNLERRGEVELKGKGKMVTYWLNGEKPSLISNHCSEPKSKSGAVTATLPRSNVITQTIDETSQISDCINRSSYFTPHSISSEAGVIGDTSATVPLLSITNVDKSSYT